MPNITANHAITYTYEMDGLCRAQFIKYVAFYFLGGGGGAGGGFGEVFLGSSRWGARSGSPNLDTIAEQYL